MATTVEELKQRVEGLEREITSMKETLRRLENGSTGPSPRRKELLPGVYGTDKKQLLEEFDQAMAEMGIDVTLPAPSGPEVQEMMLREGVRPEECLLSRGIIEAREE